MFAPPGALQLALVVLMVTAVHFVEAYGLNPAIYSAHLKLHPLLVLTVLVVAEHSLGVWGLMLAGKHDNGLLRLHTHRHMHPRSRTHACTHTA
jgi:AI-2E family transporter